MSKDTLRKVYKEIVNVTRRTPKLASPHRTYIAVCSGYKVKESTFMLALRIFDEVGTVRINEKGFAQISAKSVNLEDSIVYRNTQHAIKRTIFCELTILAYCNVLLYKV